MKKKCCKMMAFHCREISFQSKEHNMSEDEFSQVTYISRFNEYGLSCPDGSSHIVIRFCPWCGEALKPWGLRDNWFEELESKGYDDLLFNQDIPEAYKTEQWWVNEF